ncbi:hypothetical protein [Sorangium sp. So ce117]|uniref:hypothetical protein n=1 Tax=Sorangium sp. So ce117 TaxID=3133277 RepID=UPI003F5D6F94
MTMNSKLAFARWTSGCLIAVLGVGCAQIFGFDKLYEVAQGNTGGGGAGGEGGEGGNTGGGGAGGEGGTTSSTSGTSAGGGGAGGEGGAGGDAGGGGEGAGCPEPPMGDPTLELSMIDDMEDDNDTIIKVVDETNPRQGAWYVGNDGEGTQTPDVGEPFTMSILEPPRGDSTLAVHVEGDDLFSKWGALFGFQLNSASASNQGLYDASGYSGITFFAYADGPASTKVTVDVADVQTWSKGGICTTEGGGCDDHFTRVVTLKNCWTQFKVPFSALAQSSWGQQFEAIDLTKIWAIQFRFSASRAFSVWIDDVAFYKEPAPETEPEATTP